MSNIQEDTSTQLLRILVQQSGQAADMPPPPSSSIVTVSSLWFLSIMVSLAATTWAVLSLEWCAFLTADVRSEDYEETAEKKQQNYEAIHHWRMHIIVGSIPFFLHISIFLFLAGLWLRLRDVNRQLELIVGTSSLVIALSYVIITLLPIFTKAPFHTSVSEVINVLINEIKYFLRLRHLARPPPIFTWIWRSLAWISRKASLLLRPVNRVLLYLLRLVYRVLHCLLRHVAATLLIPLQWIYGVIILLAYAIWTVPKTLLWAISPVFPPGGGLLRELSRYQTGPSDQSGGVRQRALFRLMNTHLTRPEIKDVLKEWRELRDSRNVEEHLDRVSVRLLFSALSSVLWDRKITTREQPIFEHCTRLLTEEMGRLFQHAKYDAKVLCWNRTAIPDRLREFAHPKPPTLPQPTSKSAYDDYWDEVVRFLWLSPSEERIRTVIERVELHMRSARPALLQRIVRGVHAATLSSLMADKQQSIINFPLPNFSRWEFLDGGLNDDGPNNDVPDNERFNDEDQLVKDRLRLYEEVSAFLKNILTKFYDTTNPDDQHLRSPTIPELVKSLNEQDRVPSNFQSALRLFITTTWRSDPSVFNTDPSVAQILVKSVKDFIAGTTPNTPDRSKGIAIRLHAIAYGPHAPSKSIADLYGDPVKDDSECLSKFIHVTAAVLEAVLAKENPLEVSDQRTVFTTISPSFFTDGIAFNYSLNNPDHRLPYVYSLAIALSHRIEGIVQHSLEVLHLLRAPDEQPRNAVTEKTTNANEGTLVTNVAIERTLDTNTLVVNVVGQTLSRQDRAVMTGAEVQTYLDPMTRALRPLEGIIRNHKAYLWRTRWKAIYLLVDIISVLPRPLTGLEGLQSLIDDTSNAAGSYLDENAPAGRGLTKKDDLTRKWKMESAPRDWRVKREELSCGLEGAVKKLARWKESNKGVYSWREPGKIPYLSLYPQSTLYDPTSRSYWLLERIQR